MYQIYLLKKFFTLSLSCKFEKKLPLIDCIHLPIVSGDGLTFLQQLTRGALNLPEVRFQTADEVWI